MNTKEEILKTLSDNKEVIKQYGVKRIGLFGSFVRNEQTEKSDIDFTVEFIKEKKTYRNYINLVYFLQDLFNTDIDLVTLKSLPKKRNFTKDVLKETVYASL